MPLFLNWRSLRPAANVAPPASPQLVTNSGCDRLVEVETIEQWLLWLPAPVARAVRQHPQRFRSLVNQVLALPPDYRSLVDKHNGLPQHYVPPDLVRLDAYETLTLNREDLQVRQTIMPDLLAMVAAAQQDNVTLDISSAYRSYSYQEGLFARHIQQLGESEARRQSAPPGHSQHQLGTTLDFGSVTSAFAESAAGRWLLTHAHRFGFSLSYPQNMESETGYIYESWHYRHLGRSATALEREFFQGVQQHMLQFFNNPLVGACEEPR